MNSKKKWINIYIRDEKEEVSKQQEKFMIIQYLWLLHSVTQISYFSSIDINSVYFGQSSVLPLAHNSLTLFFTSTSLLSTPCFSIISSSSFFPFHFVLPLSLKPITHYPSNPTSKHKTTYKHNILSASKSIYMKFIYFSAVSNNICCI